MRAAAMVLPYALKHADKRFARSVCRPDEGCGDIFGGERALQARCLSRGDRNQQTAGGLRIEQDSLALIADATFVLHLAFGKIAIGVEPTGNESAANALQRSL